MSEQHEPARLGWRGLVIDLVKPTTIERYSVEEVAPTYADVFVTRHTGRPVVDDDEPRPFIVRGGGG